MSERAIMVDALIREVLGPRGGSRELLRPEENPLDEYITGVLAPRGLVDPSAALDSQVDEGGDGDSGPDDLGGDAGPVVAAEAVLTASLDPRSRPASMGVSFALKVQGQTSNMDIAVTFGVYTQQSDRSWRRRPVGEVWRDLPIVDGICQVKDVPGVSVHIRCRPDRQREDVRRVTVYLVNDRPYGESRDADVYVFQPEVRIRASAGAHVVPLDNSSRTRNREDRRLSVLYRERATMARGHLCSAVWHDVDPENVDPIQQSGEDFVFCTWEDGRSLWGESTPEVVEDFSPADIRSVYVPMHSVTAPNRNWRGDFGPSPELDPSVIAEAFDPDHLADLLDPLVDGVRAWLEAERCAVLEMTGDIGEICSEQLEVADAVVGRIDDGIRLLCSDADARRAFCFANRAIAMQSSWAKGGADRPPNEWYPFQLAFQLMQIPALVDEHHEDRDVCDLLWFPTGGGKTEAYLGLSAFLMAYRRIKAFRHDRPWDAAGTAIISRYTLRLLTIQQFRRAVALVTACEHLRNMSVEGAVGWRPRQDPERASQIWGGLRFSIGLWVGSGVTPAGLHDMPTGPPPAIPIRGAVSILTGEAMNVLSEPAQVTNCPCCGAVLAVQGEAPDTGAPTALHIRLDGVEEDMDVADPGSYSSAGFEIQSITIKTTPRPGAGVLSVRFVSLGVSLDYSGAVDRMVRDLIRRIIPVAGPTCARPSRPGYFVRFEYGVRGRVTNYEFEVICPAPDCGLGNTGWSELTPSGTWEPHPSFLNAEGVADRCPIPVWTTDSQIYHRLPTMVVATVDKFARLAFESRTAGMFGNVTHHDPRYGWFRTYCTPQTKEALPQRASETLGSAIPISGPIRPPELIIQDELHLIEGPLGSMVGLYEAAIDQLSSRTEAGKLSKPKYIASTATVREAESQVKSLFARDLRVFPTSVTSVDDSFFARFDRPHPLDDSQPGRLYVGLCAPGRGAQTPTIRAWSRLLQHAGQRVDQADPEDLDGLWTLVGYFNAIRELAGARTFSEQDIPQRIAIWPYPRQFAIEELSSRSPSDELPSKLDALARSLGDGPLDLVLTTSMFGTGVDVSRLRLMYVAGQPKTTSSYIQATGRVGRQRGGLVVTFLRSSRPRDLNHYEYFIGYHAALYRHVEPVTVNPFAERSRDLALGPVAVAVLRNAASIHLPNVEIPITQLWRLHERVVGGWESSASLMGDHRHSAEVGAIADLMEIRAQEQPQSRRPAESDVRAHLEAELDRWQLLALQPGALQYHEPSLNREPVHDVVLGDLAHEVAGLDVAFENAPNSLREVESTTTFKGR